MHSITRILSPRFSIKGDRPEVMPLKAAGRLLLVSGALLTAACEATLDNTKVEIDDMAREFLATASSETDGPVAGPPIKRLDIQPNDNPAAALVTAHLDAAPTAEVIRRMIRALNLTVDPVVLPDGSTTTLMFDDLPALDAMNLILAPVDLMARLDGNNLSFKPGVGVASEAASKATVQAQVAPRFLSTGGAIVMLHNLLRSGSSQQATLSQSVSYAGVEYPSILLNDSGLSVSMLPGHNALYFSGNLDLVLEAIKLLRYGDQERPHVVLESLVLEADAFALKNLGLELVNFASGELTAGSVAPGSSFADNISFSLLRGADTPRQFDALIRLLEVKENAQIVARPYASTLSGQEAKLEITEQRYVVVEDASRTRSVRPLTAGILMDIVPTVMGNGNIRVKVSVEASEFVSPPDSANVIVEKSSATTLVEVKDGQTLVIGGLYRRTSVNEKAGVPGTTDIPGLNFLTSRQADEKEESEVIVYITPRIWTKDTALLADRSRAKGELRSVQ